MIPDPTTIPDADLYEELGLEPGADEADVRRAFRRRAFDLHPDRNPDPDAARAFARARAAYEALVSPAHREAVRAAADAARVVHEVLRTALSAPPRVRPWRGPGPLRFTLEGGPHGLAPETAARVVLALAAGGTAALVATALTGAPWLFVAGLGAFAAAPVVWRRRRSPGEVALFADGFEDDRWPEAGRIGWGDVVALDPDFATGDLALALTAEAAERLAGLPDRPRRSLAWEGGRPGGRPVYRLPVGSGLMGVYQAAEVRSGYSLN